MDNYTESEKAEIISLWNEVNAETVKNDTATTAASASMARAMETVEQAKKVQQETDVIVEKHSRMSFWTKFALVIHGFILFWATGQLLNEFKPKQ